VIELPVAPPVQCNQIARAVYLGEDGTIGEAGNVPDMAYFNVKTVAAGCT
jgi:hypothetical protein